MGEIELAALALSWLPDSAPVWMIAVLMLSKRGLDLIHPGLSVLDHPRAVADIHNSVGLIKETPFIPLLTGARLPTSTAGVTEFGSAVASNRPLVSGRQREG